MSGRLVLLVILAVVGLILIFKEETLWGAPPEVSGLFSQVLTGGQEQQEPAAAEGVSTVHDGPEPAHGETELFDPGMLNVTHEDAFKRCYVNHTRFSMAPGLNGIMRASLRCFFSEQYGYFVSTVPKGGSSSASSVFNRAANAAECNGFTCWEIKNGRIALKGQDRVSDVKRDGKLTCQGLKRTGLKNITRILIKRDPLARLLSAFFEVHLRVVFNKKDFEWAMIKFPEFAQSVFDAVPGATRPEKTGGFYKYIVTTEGIDHFYRNIEIFGAKYNGESDVFNNHLIPQAKYMARDDGTMAGFDTFWDVKSFKTDVAKFGKEHGIDLSAANTHARKASFAFDRERVSTLAMQRFCRAVAIDYCCLNAELPAICRGVHEDGKAIKCRKRRDLTLPGDFFIDSTTISGQGGAV